MPSLAHLAKVKMTSILWAVSSLPVLVKSSYKNRFMKSKREVDWLIEMLL